MSELGGSKLTNIIKAKEDMNKSPEQLDAEKREIIKSRLVKLRLDGESQEKLIRQVFKKYIYNKKVIQLNFEADSLYSK